MQNSLFNLAWPIFDCLDPVPNLYKRKINLSWQSALSRIACPQVQCVKCGRKCPKFPLNGLKKLRRCWTHVHLLVCQYMLNMIWVVVLFVLTLSWCQRLYLAQVFKRKKRNTHHHETVNNNDSVISGKVSPFFHLTGPLPWWRLSRLLFLAFGRSAYRRQQMQWKEFNTLFILVSQNVVVVAVCLKWMAQFAKEAGAGTPSVGGVAECDTALAVKGFLCGSYTGCSDVIFKTILVMI